MNEVKNATADLDNYSTGACLALVFFGALFPMHVISSSALGLSLIGAVMAAVHHAEVVAHRVGEPFGTLVLAVAVTIIEVSLIVSLMLSGGNDI